MVVIDRSMQNAYEQALRDEIRASIEMTRCYARNVEEAAQRGKLADMAAFMARRSGEHATIKALLHLRRVARWYASQVTL